MKRKICSAATLPQKRPSAQKLQTAAYEARRAQVVLSNATSAVKSLPEIAGVTGYISDEQMQTLLQAQDILYELSTNLLRVADRFESNT